MKILISRTSHNCGEFLSSVYSCTSRLRLVVPVPHRRLSGYSYSDIQLMLHNSTLGCAGNL